MKPEYREDDSARPPASAEAAMWARIDAKKKARDEANRKAIAAIREVEARIAERESRKADRGNGNG